MQITGHTLIYINCNLIHLKTKSAQISANRKMNLRPFALFQNNKSNAHDTVSSLCLEKGMSDRGSMCC